MRRTFSYGEVLEGAYKGCYNGMAIPCIIITRAFKYKLQMLGFIKKQKAPHLLVSEVQW